MFLCRYFLKTSIYYSKNKNKKRRKSFRNPLVLLILREIDRTMRYLLTILFVFVFLAIAYWIFIQIKKYKQNGRND
jgi:hypothetical protein